MTGNIHFPYLLKLHQIGFKLAPVSEDGYAPSLLWTRIYESSITEQEISKYQFPNIVTCFSKTPLKDKDGNALYLNCLDIDSEEVFTRLAIITDETGKIQFFLSELCEHTYVIKTRKEHGGHVFWFSHVPNHPTPVSNCKPGQEFEIKTDRTSGLAALSPSIHRADSTFRYHNIGQNQVRNSQSSRNRDLIHEI